MIKDILKAFIMLFQIVLFIILFKWLGFKGVIGLLIGFALMGVLVVTGNPLFLSFVSMLGKKQQEKVKYVKRKWL